MGWRWGGGRRTHPGDCRHSAKPRGGLHSVTSFELRSSGPGQLLSGATPAPDLHLRSRRPRRSAPHSGFHLRTAVGILDERSGEISNSIAGAASQCSVTVELASMQRPPSPVDSIFVTLLTSTRVEIPRQPPARRAPRRQDVPTVNVNPRTAQAQRTHRTNRTETTTRRLRRRVAHGELARRNRPGYENEALRVAPLGDERGRIESVQPHFGRSASKCLLHSLLFSSTLGWPMHAYDVAKMSTPQPNLLKCIVSMQSSLSSGIR